MAGPEEHETAANIEDRTASAPPPGSFLNPELQSDTARFLAELKASIAQREGHLARTALG